MADSQQADVVIVKWEQLLAALDARDESEVNDIVYEYADGDGWLDTENFDPTECVMISMGGWGIGINYPFPLSTFWQTINVLDRKVATLASWQSLAEDIETVEGFSVEIFGPEWTTDDWNRAVELEDYGYERAASGSWTVAKWRSKRVLARFPDLDVQVLKADGQPAGGNLRLSTLRTTYQR